MIRPISILAFNYYNNKTYIYTYNFIDYLGIQTHNINSLKIYKVAIMRQAEATQSHPKPDSVALLYDVSRFWLRSVLYVYLYTCPQSFDLLICGYLVMGPMSWKLLRLNNPSHHLVMVIVHFHVCDWILIYLNLISRFLIYWFGSIWLVVICPKNIYLAIFTFLTFIES